MGFLSRDKRYEATIFHKTTEQLFLFFENILIKFVIKIILNPENLKRENFGGTHLSKV